MAAADRAITYLVETKYLAIKYLRQDILKAFQCYSDAVFADNINRHSSDGFLFTLYGGPID